MKSSVLLSFDEQSYSVEALQKAAYRLMNSFTVDIKLIDGQFRCALNPNIDTSEAGFEFAVQEFKKEVLDQQLRLKLKNETEPVRNLILGLVFSKTGLLNNE